MNKYVRTIELKVTSPARFVKPVTLSATVKDYPTKEEINTIIKKLIVKYRKRDDYYDSMKDDYLYSVRAHRKRVIPKTEEEKKFGSPYYAPNWFKPISKEQLEKWRL